MINIDPPNFGLRMTDMDFKEEKEAWIRYNQKAPPGTDMVRMEMMKRAMKPELKIVMMNYIRGRDHKLKDGPDTEAFFEEIRLNAVVDYPTRNTEQPSKL